MSAQPRFDQDRKDWATACDDLADQCYQEFWSVDKSDLYDPEGLVDDVHDRSEGYRCHQIIDYGGVDRIVDLGTRHVYVSQRFRPTHRIHRDLSLRTDNGIDGRHPELHKWLCAYRKRGFYPSVIAYGLFDDVLGVFSEFYLLDTTSVLRALDTEAMDGIEHDSGDGTAALYVSLDQLHEHDCIIACWDGVTGDE